MLDFIHTHGMLISGLIFFTIYVFIATEKFQKSVVALIGASVVMLLGLIPLSGHLDMQNMTYIKGAFEYVDFEVVFLLIGMMIIVDISSRSGIYKWMAINLLKIT